MKRVGFRCGQYRHSFRSYSRFRKAILVVGLELARLAVERDRAGEDLFFQRQIGVEIDLGGFDESCPSHSAMTLLHAGMEEVHRRCMAQAVEGDVLLLQRGAGITGHRDVLFQEARHGVRA